VHDCTSSCSIGYDTCDNLDLRMLHFFSSQHHLHRAYLKSQISPWPWQLYLLWHVQFSLPYFVAESSSAEVAAVSRCSTFQKCFLMHNTGSLCSWIIFQFLQRMWIFLRLLWTFWTLVLALTFRRRHLNSEFVLPVRSFLRDGPLNCTCLTINGYILWT
jgi:hypothetical protein